MSETEKLPYLPCQVFSPGTLAGQVHWLMDIGIRSASLNMLAASRLVSVNRANRSLPIPDHIRQRVKWFGTEGNEVMH